MSQALKFRSKLAVSLLILAASSGAAIAQPTAEDRPALSYASGKPAGALASETKNSAVSSSVTQTTTTTTKSTSSEDAAERSAAPAKHTFHKKVRKVAVASVQTNSDMKFKAPLPGEVEVSDRDYNHFIFPSAITQLVFPPGSAIVGKPVYLNNNTQALVEIARGSEKPIQMIVETESGRVTKLYLKPRPINGITYRVDGAREAAPLSQSASAKAAAGDASAGSPHGDEIELLKRAVQGDIPPDFDSIALPRPTRFDRFTVVPLAGWSNGSRRIMSFSLVAVPGKTAVVSDPQFYRAGITAVLLTGDHVDEATNPKLFVVEEVSSDE